MDLETIDHFLTTTRSVRKRLDLTRPVPRGLIERCIDIALQAPTGSNAQGWQFVIVTDAHKRAQIADLYRRGFELYRQLNDSAPPPQLHPDDPRYRQTLRIVDSAEYLAEHLHEVPVHVIPCIEGRVEEAGVLAQASIYGSILPAVWSFMLALRVRGVGAAWTTLHLMFEQQTAEILGIPSGITQTALLRVAYFTGKDFKPAKRLPARDHLHWDT